MDRNQDLFAFVLMPFDSKFDDLYRFGIKEPAASVGVVAERVDEQLYKEGILDRIYRQIDVADVVIAEMTDQNPNVFYEVGYAHGKGKLCILSTDNDEDIPFDLKHRRHIVHGGSIQTLKRRLLEELAWARTEVENVRRSHIQLKVRRIYGTLETTEHMAVGEVNFSLDLSNESHSHSPELEAAYFYSSKTWTITQNDKECPWTESDLARFERRHFLTLPVRRVRKGSWAQLNFTAKKVLATTWNGDVLKDTYRVNGRSMVRLVTADGDLDYEVPVDVEVDEIPF